MSLSRPSRAGRKTRPLYTSITRTQPSRLFDAGADMHTCSSSVAGITTSGPIDSEGRIYVQLSPNYNQFVGVYPTPDTWIGEYWRCRVLCGFWPTFRKLPDEEKDNIWEAFKLKYTWTEDYEEGMIKSVFMAQCSSQFRVHIGNTKKECWKKLVSPVRPTWMADDVFAEFCAFWGMEKAAKIVEQTRQNKASSSGSGTKHTMGTINVAEHNMRLKRHTRPGTFVDKPPQWVDRSAPSSFSVYKITVSEEETDPIQPIPFTPQVWKEISLEGRKKRGDRVFEMGDEELQCSPSTGRSHAIRPDAQEISRIEILEARLAEQQRLAAEYQEQSERQLAEIMAVMKSMAQQMHGFPNVPSSNIGPPSHVRNLFQDRPPPPPL